jgi:hypothetical protein
MGIISIMTFALALMFLWSIRKQIRILRKDAAEEDDDGVVWFLKWASRGMMFVMLASLVFMVDSYFYKFPNPFGGPEVENMREQASEVQEPGTINLKAEPSAPDVKKAREEHKNQLKKFTN